MSKTKIVGVIMVLIAVLQTAVDALNGGGFDLTLHLKDLDTALAGAGLVFLRQAIDKIR